jgi:hypothetical protein
MVCSSGMTVSLPVPVWSMILSVVCRICSVSAVCEFVQLHVIYDNDIINFTGRKGNKIMCLLLRLDIIDYVTADLFKWCIARRQGNHENPLIKRIMVQTSASSESAGCTSG